MRANRVRMRINKKGQIDPGPAAGAAAGGGRTQIESMDYRVRMCIPAIRKQAGQSE